MMNAMKIFLSERRFGTDVPCRVPGRRCRGHRVEKGGKTDKGRNEKMNRTMEALENINDITKHT